MKQVRTFLLMLAIFGLSVSVNAQFGGGSGTVGSPYQISTAAHLEQLATFVNNGDVNYNDKFYILTTDIDLSDYQSGAGWTPIGNGADTDKIFKGYFNGNGKIITGLKINNTTLGYLGLFGSVDGGIIKNVGIEDADIVSQYSTSIRVGCIAGYISASSSISNCYATGTIDCTNSGGNPYIGGLVGTLLNSEISNCYSAVSVSSDMTGNSANQSGGIVAIANNSAISNCYCIGAVSTTAVASGTGHRAAGIVGNITNTTISNCAALNPSIYNEGINFGRVIGNTSAMLANNIGFDEMLNPDGDTTWGDVGLTLKDGADFSKQEIYEDGTLGGRFSASDGWTIVDGYLPGLFGKPVEMPAHLFFDTPADLCHIKMVTYGHVADTWGSNTQQSIIEVFHEGTLYYTYIPYTTMVQDVGGYTTCCCGEGVWGGLFFRSEITLQVPSGTVEFYITTNSGNYPSLQGAIEIWKNGENVYCIANPLGFPAAVQTLFHTENLNCNDGAGDCNDYNVVGSNTNTTLTIPVHTYYNYSYTQQIYEEAEIGDTGDITSIAFQYIYGTSQNNKTDQSVYIGHTTKTVFNDITDWISLDDLTLVYDGSLDWNNSETWFTIQFDTPFVYTGGNLVVVVLNNHGSYNTNNNPTFNVHDVTGNRTIIYRKDDVPVGPIDPSNPAGFDNTRIFLYEYTNHIQFNICQPPPVCYPPTNLEVEYNSDCEALLTWDVPASNSITTVPFSGPATCGGIAFDMIAGTQNITITEFEFPFGGAGTRSVHAYYRTDSSCGNTESSNGWISIGVIDVNVVNIQPDLTSMPLPAPIVIPAGEIYGFYFAVLNAEGDGIKYSREVIGDVCGVNITSGSNSDLTIMEGTGLHLITAPFEHTYFWPGRDFSGVVHYSTDISFNIYRNDSFIATVDDVLNYIDSGFDPTDSHEWYVTQVCGTDESYPSNIVSLDACTIICNPPSNLEVEYNNYCEAVLTWEVPTNKSRSKSISEPLSFPNIVSQNNDIEEKGIMQNRDIGRIFTQELSEEELSQRAALLSTSLEKREKKDIISQSNNSRGPNSIAYGVHIYSPLSVPLNNPANMTTLGSTLPDAVCGADWINGAWYAISHESAAIYKIDTLTGACSTIDIGFDYTTGISYNPIDGNVYICQFDFSSYPTCENIFYTIDLNTGATTHISTISHATICIAFTIDNTGRCFALWCDNTIKEINITDGNIIATIINTDEYGVYLDDSPYIQNITTDRQDNTVYWASRDQFTYYSSTLWEVDVNSNSMTSLGDFSDWISGFVVPSVKYNIYRDETLVATVFDTNYVDSGFDTSESHEWYITQVCDFGESDPSNIVSLEDCELPEVLNVTISPKTATVQLGGTQQFTALVETVGEADESVTWTISESSSTLTNIDNDGLLTIGINETVETITVTVTSVFDTTIFDEAIVTIHFSTDPEVIDVTISPKTVTVQVGNTQQFTAFVDAVNGADESVTWTISESSSTLTNIDNDGLLSIGINETEETITVTVTSVFNTTIFDEAIVTIKEVGIDVNTYGRTSPQIYPNPTSGVFFVRHCGLDPQSPQNKGMLKQVQHDAALEIYDISGRLVHHEPFTVNREPSTVNRATVEIDITHLSNGIYFLKIGKEMVKIVKK